MVLVGAGDLGRALAHYQGFHDRGFRIRMVFDNNPSKIGQTLAGFVISDTPALSNWCGAKASALPCWQFRRRRHSPPRSN